MPELSSIDVCTNRPIDQSAALLTLAQKSAALVSITDDSASILTPAEQCAKRFVGVWRPTDLGTDLLAWWDVTTPASMTIAGGKVSAWADLTTNEYVLAQGTGANQPGYTTGAWGMTFDGTDDYLSLESQPFPAGSDGSELWALVDQTSPVSDTSTRAIFGYGAASNIAARRLDRRVVSSQIRATALSGDGSAGATSATNVVFFTGQHFLRGIFTDTGVSIAVNGGAPRTPTAVTTNTGSTRVRVGATTPNTAASFWLGSIAALLVTNPLSALNAGKLAAYLDARRSTTFSSQNDPESTP
jgi:hypothetical protein